MRKVKKFCTVYFPLIHIIAIGQNKSNTAKFLKLFQQRMPSSLFLVKCFNIFWSKFKIINKEKQGDPGPTVISVKSIYTFLLNGFMKLTFSLVLSVYFVEI